MTTTHVLCVVRMSESMYAMDSVAGAIPESIPVSDAREKIASAMTEEELLRSVMIMAMQLGYLCYHQRPARTARGWRTAMTGHPGVPDLLLCRDPDMGHDDGRVLFVELKSSRGRLGEHQALWLATLEEAGAEVYVWKPSDLVEGTVAAVLSGERRTA